MAKSPPVLPKPTVGPPSSAREGPSLSPLKVVYYRRMKRQRVYTVTAAWYNPEKRRPPGGAEPLVLRLLMAGAQVVPSEQLLDPAKPDAKAVFYVTPLARGWLRHECLEVLQGGRKVQEMPLSAKVTTQRMTWTLLILTFLVPWLLYNYVQNSPLANTKPGKTTGEILAIHVTDFLPDTPAFIQDNLSEAHEKVVNFRNDLVSSAYNFLWNTSQSHPLVHYAAAVFLLLTIISWFFHRDRRKRRYGKPVPLVAGTPSQSGGADKYGFA